MRHAAFKSAGTAQRRTGAPAKGYTGSRRVVVVARCASTPSDDVLGRRQLLSAAGAAVLAAGVAPLVAPRNAAAAPRNTSVVEVEQLGLIQKQAQIKDFRIRAEAAIKEVVGPADASGCMRLVLNDVGGYDVTTKTGGMDGSVVLPEELGRTENAGLDSLVAKLAKAKAKIDAAGEADGAGPISWADLLVLAAKVSTQASWTAIKISRAAIPSGGETIAGPAFGASWPVRLGRVDSATPSAPGRVPSASAPVAEIKAYMMSIGAKPGQVSTGGFFPTKPPVWERPALVLWSAAASDPLAEEARFAAEDPATFKGYKDNYDRSRKTVTRTDYEVDFIDYFTLITGFATFKKDAYVHSERVANLF